MQDISEKTKMLSEDGADKQYGFHLVLFSDNDDMHELWLPMVAEGFYRLSDHLEHQFLSILSRDGQWVASCKRPAFFQNVPLEQSYEVPLTDSRLLILSVDDRQYSLYVRKVQEKKTVYHHYQVYVDGEISIGRLPHNDICYDNPYVSDRHAVLRRSNGKWNIQDQGSIYGVYVNGIRRINAELNSGDVISIMGLKMIIGPNCLAIQDETEHLTVNRRTLQEAGSSHSGYGRYSGQEPVSVTETYFNRLPRKRFEMPPKTITVEGPPMSIDQKQIPLILRMGSSMVMGGAAALAGNFMTLISSVMFPFLSSKYTEKQRQDYEQLRLSKYREYLKQKRVEIERACEEEKEFLNRKYPKISHAAEVVRQKVHLWERRPSDNDFLEIRLGTGRRPVSVTVEYPARRFELETDKLEDEMYQLVEKPRYADGMPVVLSVADTRVCGFLGQRARIMEYVRQIVLQISAFHSYDEVKMVFFVNSKELACLEELRYLPHVWDDWRTIRFIATEEADAYKLGEYIKGQISNDKEGEKEIHKILKKRPYYLIFALDKKLFECHEVLKEILQSGEVNGLSIFTAYDDLPKESQKIITLESGDRNVCTTMSADGGDDVCFQTDPCSAEEFSEAMRILANTRLKIGTQTQELPKMVTFLEMFGAGRVEQLNPLKRWKESNPVKSLAAPVGIGADGSLFMLDLHEKRQGPHGLVAGMTGSGKSEFIITYILSMAVNYHPDEVAFVLIDYKGGGLAGAFENPQTGVKLPHLVGTITNLDGASIQRSLMSIESELLRRQRIFNEIKSTVNEGTMDIYTYQKLYRAGKVSKPMPHLFIVSDEFAELKQQQPEFMDKLISAARIGRSLGVHLILATQKPSGVVNDQIRSNTKFRVCLRVQDRSDSMDMLKRPEAAELTDTGRFYLQVGYNEYFAMGQSAWCGAQYEPQDTVIVQKDDAVEFLDTAGQVIAKAKPQVKKTDSGVKQIVAIVKYLSDLAQNHGIQTNQLWLEPLERIIELNDLHNLQEEASTNKVYAAIGIIDDPEKQCKYPLMLDILKGQHSLIIGNAGSGKTTMIKSLLLELTRNYTPEKLNYYIVDCSGGTLGVFKKAPHCGAFLTENDETDMERFLEMLRGWIVERKTLFGQAGVTSYEAYCHVSPIPLILVVFDNFSGFTSMSNGNTYFATFHELLKETPNLGIRIMVSCNNLNELSMRSKQEINNRIALQMKDRFAYSEVLNCRCLIEPTANPGRGLCQIDGRVLEYQVAIPFADQNEQARTFSIMEEIATITQRNFCEKSARKLPVVVEDETYEAFCQDIPIGRIPLGYELKKASKISMPLAQMFRVCVYLGNSDGVVPILKNIRFAVQKNSGQMILVKRSLDSVFDKMPDLAEGFRETDIFDSSSESSLKLCEFLISEVLHRKTFRDMYCDESGIPVEKRMQPTVLKKASGCIRSHTTPLFFLIEDFCEFSANMSSTAADFLENIFKNGKGYNFYFISCFYPESRNKLSADMLAKQYAEDAPMLFFGGQFQSQALTTLPPEYRSINTVQKKYNRFLMRYDGNFYPLVMPCGIIQMEEVDPDERPILS